MANRRSILSPCHLKTTSWWHYWCTGMFRIHTVYICKIGALHCEIELWLIYILHFRVRGYCNWYMLIDYILIDNKVCFRMSIFISSRSENKFIYSLSKGGDLLELWYKEYAPHSILACYTVYILNSVTSTSISKVFEYALYENNCSLELSKTKTKQSWIVPI